VIFPIEVFGKSLKAMFAASLGSVLS